MTTASPEGEPAAVDRRSRVARRLLDTPLRTLGIGVTVLVLGSTAAFGGLARADPADDVRAVVMGATAQAAPFDIRVERVVRVDALPNVYPTQRGNRWLAVRAVLRNRTDTATTGAELRRSVTLSGVQGLVTKPEAGTDRVTSTYQLVLADTGQLNPVQPGLDYPMVFLFEQQAATAPPAEVTVELVAHTWRQDSLDHTWRWLDPHVVARSTLPMEVAG